MIERESLTICTHPELKSAAEQLAKKEWTTDDGRVIRPAAVSIKFIIEHGFVWIPQHRQSHHRKYHAGLQVRLQHRRQKYRGVDVGEFDRDHHAPLVLEQVAHGSIGFQ